MSVGSIGASIPGLMTAGSPLKAQATKNTAASLEGQIRAAREQLNDWVTCVSATTPKGQAEIRSLSAQISAAQEHINRLQPLANGGTADSLAAAGAGVDLWV